MLHTEAIQNQILLTLLRLGEWGHQKHVSKQEEHTQACFDSTQKDPHMNPLKRALHSSYRNSEIIMISTCTSTQEMAQSSTPSDQNLLQNLRILGIINIGEKLVLTSPCGITSQCTGIQCTYWSSKDKRACLRIKAIAAEKASWLILSFIGVRTHSHLELTEEPILPLLQSVQKSVEHKEMLLLFLFFDAFNLWKSFVHWS